MLDIALQLMHQIWLNMSQRVLHTASASLAEYKEERERIWWKGLLLAWHRQGNIVFESFQTSPATRATSRIVGATLKTMLLRMKLMPLVPLSMTLFRAPVCLDKWKRRSKAWR